MKSWCAALAIVLCAPFVRADDDELDRARFLDQQGVRAFGENRIRDALALFNASYRAGGPPTELWNVARCELKLDEPEAARHTLEKYLEQKDLGEDDRAEGKRLLDEIEHRSSSLVVASTPAGAVITVDGRVVGSTPYSSTLSPGAHDVKIGRTETAVTRHVEARDGRAVILSVELGPIERATQTKPHAKDIRRFSAELGLLAVISSLGGTAVVEGRPAPELTIGYAPFVFHSVLVGFGFRLRASFDQWSTSAGVSTSSTCASPADYSAVELLAMPTVFGAWRVGRRVTLGARAGFGGAIYATSAPIGGDLFAPSCIYGGSLAPDVYAALDVSLRMTDLLRVVFYPATFDLHSGYAGARNDASIDASGPWVRVGVGIAVAVDL